MIDPTRIQKLNKIEKINGECIIYVISRDQRVQDNFALLYAIEHANSKKIPLVALFNVYPKVNGRILQQYEFMFQGLKEVQSDLNKLNIDLIVSVGKLVKNLKSLEQSFKPEAIYFDFSPLRGPRKVKEDFSKISNVPNYVVDTHNIIPIWVTSDKEEHAAYTIRPKIHRNLENYLVEPENPSKVSVNNKNLKDSLSKIEALYLNPDLSQWHELLSKVKAKNIEGYKPEFESGSAAGLKILTEFIQNKLQDYGEKRNDPTIDFQSGLSPYLHYGQVSSLRAVLEVKKFVENKTGTKIELDPNRNKAGHASELKGGIVKGAEAFIEQLVVRKELTENFCYYNKNYDNFEGIKEWAKNSLIKHNQDKRVHIYTLEELEFAKTDDDAWNAAQIQLIKTGKMHGYMRMYWAKRFLEWTPDAATAIEYAVYLNDKYHIDGYDPNGYAGIMWSIGAIHDRPWFEREIFGQIRYMNYNGLKSKFNLKKYIEKFIS